MKSRASGPGGKHCKRRVWCVNDEFIVHSNGDAYSKPSLIAATHGVSNKIVCTEIAGTHPYIASLGLALLLLPLPPFPVCEIARDSTRFGYAQRDLHTIASNVAQCEENL